MGKKGKVSGGIGIDGAINNNGGNIGVNGNIKYKDGPVKIKAEGHINKHIPSHGKGQVNGGGQISITHQF